MHLKILATIILIFTGLSGCASIGPGTTARDFFDYIISAIPESGTRRCISILSCYVTAVSGSFLMWNNRTEPPISY